MKLQLFAAVFFSAAIGFVACKKEDQTTTLRVRLTDAPTALEEVNVDLKEVTVKLASDTSKWVSMQTVPGIYNLLALQNGVDTLISEATLPQGRVKEIRLVLGANNTIKQSGQTYPLTIPSGSESGLKLKIDKKLDAALDSLVIDFDAALSIKQEADGYKLRPVLKVK